MTQHCGHRWRSSCCNCGSLIRLDIGTCYHKYCLRVAFSSSIGATQQVCQHTHSSDISVFMCTSMSFTHPFYNTLVAISPSSNVKDSFPISKKKQKERGALRPCLKIISFLLKSQKLKTSLILSRDHLLNVQCVGLFDFRFFCFEF